MNAAPTVRAPERRTEPVAYDGRTWPPALVALDGYTDAIVWSEHLLGQVRACAGDGARFMSRCTHGA